MQARTLPMRQGWRWFFDGFALFRRNPALLTLLVLSYWLLIGLMNIIPLLGSILATLSIPVFSVGLMTACRDLDQRNPPAPGVLFAGFRLNLPVLLTLGGLYLAATIAVLAVSSLADDGVLMRVMLTGQPPPSLEGDNSSFLAATQIALVLLVPLLMAWWYAPLLAAWHGLSAGKALFFSFVACLRNWRAFLGYSLAVVTFSAILPGVLLGTLVAFIPGTAAFLTTLFTVPLLFVVAPTLVATFYVSYRDVFVIDEHV